MSLPTTSTYSRKIAMKLAYILSIIVTDHRTRLCMDMLVAQVISEETVPGFPGPITTKLYSMWPAPPAEVTVTGSLFTSFGIGGENTGRSIKTGKDVFELVLDAA